jgi:putative heme-binding domain-containing protein
VRAGFEPPVVLLLPLLSDLDRFVRTAARLALQRIPGEKWVGRLWNLDSDLAVWEGIIALCKTGQAEPQARLIFRHLHKGAPHEPVEMLLNYLRTLQMALFHIKERPGSVRGIALECLELFPHADPRVSRELAILLTHFKMTGQLDEPVQGKLIDALLASKDDSLQQIHYFYCLRLIPQGWSAEQKQAVTAWYDGTQKLSGGGHSFTPFLENIYREILGGFTVTERKGLLEAGDRQPLPALVLVQLLQKQPLPELLPALKNLSGRLAAASPKPPRADELKLALAEVQVQTVLRDSREESFPVLVEALNTPNKVLLLDVVEALKKNPGKPKAEDPVPYRNLLLASKRLDPPTRWKAVELLRHWSNNKQFGADVKDWKTELGSWARWYGQAFPRQPALADVTGDKPVESKYRFDELVGFLEKEGRKGDITRGRQVFEKAQCLKCHKYGKEGEGIGPDLTTLSKRFKRADVLESILYPSKVISDQYRSTQFVTRRGQTILGLAAAPVDGVITVLQSDGSKVSLKVGDIDQQFTSLISVMPEKLLDVLEKQEIADLFAFMESEPAK